MYRPPSPTRSVAISRALRLLFGLCVFTAVPAADAAWTSPPPNSTTTGQYISLAFYYVPSYATSASIWAQAPGSSTWIQIGGGGGGGSGGSISGSGGTVLTTAGTWYFKATEGSTPNGLLLAGVSSTIVSAGNHSPTFGLTRPSYLFTNQSFTMGIGASDLDGDLHSMGIRWQGMGLVGGPWMISGSSASATTGTLTAPSSPGSINVRGEVWDEAGNSVTGSWESIPVYIQTSFSFGAATYNGNDQDAPVNSNPAGASYSLSGNYRKKDAGTYSATVTGTGNYYGSFTGNWTIAKANQSITFGSLSNKTYGDPSFNVSASASSGLAISFSVVSGPATISGSTVTLTGTGTVTIRASQSGNSNYNAASPVDRSFVVDPPLPPAPAITSASSATGTVGVAFSYQITATNSPTSYDASGLPSGLSVNTITGSISGTPATTGTSNATIGATNSGGRGSRTLTITVGAAPSITTQPQNQTVALGGSTTFSVGASGTPALTYQWRKNGAPISGATTSSLVFSNAQSGDAATYSVVVANAYGSVTSSGATLTVGANGNDTNNQNELNIHLP